MSKNVSRGGGTARRSQRFYMVRTTPHRPKGYGCRVLACFSNLFEQL